MGKDTDRRPSPADFFAGRRDKSMQVAWEIYLRNGQRDDYISVLTRDQYMRFREYLARYGLGEPDKGTAGRKRSDVPEKIIEAYNVRDFAKIQQIFDDGEVTKWVHQICSREGPDRLFISLREATSGHFKYKPEHTKDLAEAIRRGGVPVGELHVQNTSQMSAYYTLVQLRQEALRVLYADQSLSRYVVKR